MNALLQPGELVIARFGAGRFPSGKPRPAIVIADAASGFRMCEITTSEHYANAAGSALEVPNPAAVGLKGPGLLRDMTTIAWSHDIDVHIGWVDAELVDQLAKIRDIPARHILRLRRVAAHHHPPTAIAA